MRYWDVALPCIQNGMHLAAWFHNTEWRNFGTSVATLEEATHSLNFGPARLEMDLRAHLHPSKMFWKFVGLKLKPLKVETVALTCIAHCQQRVIIFCRDFQKQVAEGCARNARLAGITLSNETRAPGRHQQPAGTGNCRTEPRSFGVS